MYFSLLFVLKRFLDNKTIEELNIKQEEEIFYRFGVFRIDGTKKVTSVKLIKTFSILWIEEQWISVMLIRNFVEFSPSTANFEKFHIKNSSQS